MKVADAGVYQPVIAMRPDGKLVLVSDRMEVSGHDTMYATVFELVP